MCIECTSTHIFSQVHTLTYTLSQIYSDISHSQAHTFTHLFTQLHIFTHTDPSVSYISTQAFSHSCSIHIHSPGRRHKYTGLGDPGFGVTQPPFPCPELQASVLSGAHTHAKLAWEGHRLAGAPPCRSSWALPGEEQGVPAPQLGVRRVSFLPQLPTPGSGQAEWVLPG